jgi:glycosyltransferase involved in cell wall biosynthesis
MTWFASWHGLLPGLYARLQGKPFVIVVGGYDTACLPGIAYGHQRGGLKSALARAVMALASVRIGISEFTMRELAALGFGGAGDRLVPLGLDPARYSTAPHREPGLVVTVGGVYRSNLARKGHEAFVRAAALCPAQHFVLIGPWRDDAIGRLRGLASPNVTFTGELSHADKVAWLSRAEVIVQASQHEAFGLALAEGMLCGAVPVVTDAGALPWVAGGTGVVVPAQDPAALAHGIRSALALGAVAGRAARDRVLAEFSVQRRAERLEHVLAGLGIEAAAPATAEGAIRAA